MHYRRQPGCPTLGQHKADFACGSTSLLSRINIGINLSLTLPRQKSQPALQQAFASAPQPSCERGRGIKGAWALPVFQGGMGRRKNETRSPWHLQAWQTNTPWRRGAALHEGKQTELPSDQTRTCSSLSAHYIWIHHKYQGSLIATLNRLDSTFLIKCLIDLHCA